MIARRATFVLGSYQRYENPHALKPVRGRESPQFKTYSSGVREAVESKNSQQNPYLIYSWKAKTSSRGMPVKLHGLLFCSIGLAKLQWITAFYNRKSPHFKTKSPHFETDTDAAYPTD